MNNEEEMKQLKEFSELYLRNNNPWIDFKQITYQKNTFYYLYNDKKTLSRKLAGNATYPIMIDNMDDEEHFVNLLLTNTSKKQSLHLEIPPQPWQGNPDAKMWILLTNPGYNPLDSQFYSTSAHREATLSQLQFKCSGEHWHYVVNPEYRKWKSEDDKDNYSWTWFRDRFVKQVKKVLRIRDDEKAFQFLDENIFLLQSFGYASEGSQGDLFPLRFHSQARFIRKLLKWGVDNGKSMYIMRSDAIWQYWLDDEKDICAQLEKDNRLFINPSPRISHLPEYIIKHINK